MSSKVCSTFVCIFPKAVLKLRMTFSFNEIMDEHFLQNGRDYEFKYWQSNSVKPSQNYLFAEHNDDATKCISTSLDLNLSLKEITMPRLQYELIIKEGSEQRSEDRSEDTCQGFVKGPYEASTQQEPTQTLLLTMDRSSSSTLECETKKTITESSLSTKP
ncbi:unnamed protein product [Moneuplotes crassus]|uniref:Uncharacterized protein n=1 Tax=Euplotes crassus TaxID=5936 RepID=A0AAD1XJB7_EUPCR|nr:unnamed protein product [Moneuplotes crassus]